MWELNPHLPYTLMVLRQDILRFNHVAYIPTYHNSVEMHRGFTLVLHSGVAFPIAKVGLEPTTHRLFNLLPLANWVTSLPQVCEFIYRSPVKAVFRHSEINERGFYLSCVPIAVAFLIHPQRNSELSYGCPQTPKGIFCSQNGIFNELTLFWIFHYFHKCIVNFFIIPL